MEEKNSTQFKEKKKTLENITVRESNDMFIML